MKLVLIMLVLLLNLGFSEKEVIGEVAREYNLSVWQTKLLSAIRKAENGKLGEGTEFGVLHPRAVNTTFRNQAQWAAGSIKKRCPSIESLETFAARWAPLGAKNDPTNLNSNWLKNVRWFLNGV